MRSVWAAGRIVPPPGNPAAPARALPEQAPIRLSKERLCDLVTLVVDDAAGEGIEPDVHALLHVGDVASQEEGAAKEHRRPRADQRQPPRCHVEQCQKPAEEHERAACRG